MSKIFGFFICAVMKRGIFYVLLIFEVQQIDFFYYYQLVDLGPVLVDVNLLISSVEIIRPNA
jgi:hypothetical protein